MSRQPEYTKIMLGRIELEEVKNVVREIKMLWHNFENIWPNGDRKQLPSIKVTRDQHGQYFAHVNARGLTYILLYCKNIPAFTLEKKDAETSRTMPPDFLLPSD